MSSETLIEAIKELLEQWEDRRERYRNSDGHEFFVMDDCIDDLKGILPPEEE